MDKVFIGVPVYGQQPRSFWQPLATECGNLYKQNIEFIDLFAPESMMVDVNRNQIVYEFLKSKADWLKWLDADNVDRLYSIRRLLDTQKSLVTGVYVKRQENAEPVVYTKDANGNYQILDNFRPGEIKPIDGAGLGGTLCHRSVFEDIQSNYRMLDIATGGGVVLAHKHDIIGDIQDDAMDENDGKIVNGVEHRRLKMPNKDKPFCFFMLKDGRTEDFGFYECASRSGHQAWCDTGVPIGHIGNKTYDIGDWMKWKRQ
jgi:hypothetical protein